MIKYYSPIETILYDLPIEKREPINFKSTARSRRGVLLGLKSLIVNLRKEGRTISLLEIERILD